MPPESPFAYLGDGEIRAWYAFMKVQLRLRYEMNHRLREDAGISLSDYDVLVALTSEESGTLAVSDLATRIGVERSRVSHQVKRLAVAGLLSVGANEGDRRVSDVSLTAAGRALLRRASPQHIDFVRSVFFDALSEEQLDELAGAFEDVYDRLIAHGTLPRPADHP